MPRTRVGNIFEENSGASRNSGVDAREHEEERRHVLAGDAGNEVVQRRRLTADQPPTSCGIELNRFCV